MSSLVLRRVRALSEGGWSKQRTSLAQLAYDTIDMLDMELPGTSVGDLEHKLTQAIEAWAEEL